MEAMAALPVMFLEEPSHTVMFGMILVPRPPRQPQTFRPEHLHVMSLDANDCPATDQETLIEPDQLMIDSVTQDDVALTVTIYVSGWYISLHLFTNWCDPIEQFRVILTHLALCLVENTLFWLGCQYVRTYHGYCNCSQYW